MTIKKSTNPYYATPPKACPVSASDAEVLILKEVLRQSLLASLTLGYKDRLVAWITNLDDDDDRKCLRIVQPAIPDVSEDILLNNGARAVDRFVDKFIQQSDLNLNDVTISPDPEQSTRRSWAALKRLCTIQDLLAGSWINSIFAQSS